MGENYFRILTIFYFNNLPDHLVCSNLSNDNHQKLTRWATYSQRCVGRVLHDIVLSTLTVVCKSIALIFVDYQLALINFYKPSGLSFSDSFCIDFESDFVVVSSGKQYKMDVCRESGWFIVLKRSFARFNHHRCVFSSCWIIAGYIGDEYHDDIGCNWDGASVA